ncbi:hypothetical protein Q3G72_032874 [Acer saccharum]|nr:hypothetical protein Q3G72_032874 [Acer saccharum]
MESRDGDFDDLVTSQERKSGQSFSARHASRPESSSRQHICFKAGQKQHHWILWYIHNLKLTWTKLELVLNKLCKTSAV